MQPGNIVGVSVKRTVFNAAQTAPVEADTATEDESALIQLFRGLNIKNRAMVIAYAQGKRDTQ